MSQGEALGALVARLTRALQELESLEREGRELEESLRAVLSAGEVARLGPEDTPRPGPGDEGPGRE